MEGVEAVLAAEVHDDDAAVCTGFQQGQYVCKNLRQGSQKFVVVVNCPQIEFAVTVVPDLFVIGGTLSSQDVPVGGRSYAEIDRFRGDELSQVRGGSFMQSPVDFVCRDFFPKSSTRGFAKVGR